MGMVAICRRARVYGQRVRDKDRNGQWGHHLKPATETLPQATVLTMIY